MLNRHHLSARCRGRRRCFQFQYGIDTRSYSFLYLATWTEERQVLTRILSAIQRVAAGLIAITALSRSSMDDSSNTMPLFRSVEAILVNRYAPDRR